MTYVKITILALKRNIQWLATTYGNTGTIDSTTHGAATSGGCKSKRANCGAELIPRQRTVMRLYPEIKAVTGSKAGNDQMIITTTGGDIPAPQFGAISRLRTLPPVDSVGVSEFSGNSVAAISVLWCLPDKHGSISGSEDLDPARRNGWLGGYKRSIR